MLSINIKQKIVKLLISTVAILILSNVLTNSTIVADCATKAQTKYTKDGVTYTYSNKVLTITGSGTVTDAWEDELYNASGTKYSTSINTIKFDSASLTGCSSDAFDAASCVTTVNINQSNFSTEITCFQNKKGITTVRVGSKGKATKNMFKGCTGITTVNFFGSSIPSYCFYGCTGITKLNMRTGNSTDGYTYYVESIGDYAFYGCTGITSTIIISKKVTSLGTNAFYGCTSVTNMTIGMISIPDNAFKNYNINNINITISSTCKSIGDYAFYGWTGIKKIEITGANITSIGDYAFYGCKGLISTDLATCKSAFDFAALGGSLTSVGKYAFKFSGFSSGTSAEPNVSISQSIEKSSTNYYPSDKTAKVTMTVNTSGSFTTEGIDYVVCLDVTGSMDDAYFCSACGKVSNSQSTTEKHIKAIKKDCGGTVKNQWVITKEATCNFISNVLSSNSKNRVALVIFGAGAYTNDAGETAGCQCRLAYDFTNDGTALKNCINRLVLDSENTSLNTKIINGASTGGRTNYATGLRGSLIVAQKRTIAEASRTTNLVFISDGEANGGTSLIEPLSKVCKATFSNIWSIGVCVSSTIADASTRATALDRLETISTTFGGSHLFLDVPEMDMDNKLNDFLNTTAEVSQSYAAGLTLTSTFNSSAWEFSSGSDVSRSVSTVYANIESLNGSKTYTFYLKLKDTYLNSLSTAGVGLTVPALTKLTLTYNVTGGLYSGSTLTKEDSTQYSLDWNVYTVTVDLDGGTFNNSTGPFSYSRSYGVTQDMGTPTKDYYLFDGWELTGGGSISGTTYTFGSSDGALKAKWKPATFDMTINGNGGTVGGASAPVYEVTVGKGDWNTFTTSAFYRRGWSYDGIYTASGESTQVYGTNGVVVNDGTYWADNVWKYVGDATFYVHWKDDVSPEVYLTQSPENSTLTRGSVTITAHAVDYGVGLDANAYKWNDGDTWTSASSITVSKNGTYKVTVRDKNGNTASASITVTNIDKLDPIATVTKSPTAWTRGNVTLTVSAHDHEATADYCKSGLAAQAYRWYNAVTSSWSTYSSSTQFTATENGTYKLTVKDAVGNWTTKEIVVKNIDRTPPQISYKILTKWFKGKTYVTWLATDLQPDGTKGSGLASNAWSFDGGNTWTDVCMILCPTDGTYTAMCRDNVGNISTASVTITYDNSGDSDDPEEPDNSDTSNSSSISSSIE